MKIALIWAMAKNRVIGRDNGLPWRLPDDMRHFMNTTMGRPVIMGRRTFESMPGPLPGRANIVLTSRANYSPDGILVAADFDAGLAVAAECCAKNGTHTAFIIGVRAGAASGRSTIRNLGGSRGGGRHLVPRS